MKKNVLHTIQRIIFGILLLVFQVANSQTNLQNETNLKAKAAEYFLQDNYIDAFPLYSQLLSLDPKNPELNYRFGVCMMFTQRTNPEEPLKYLEKAINQVSDVEFYYFLALAYQNNYFFTDAITNYKKYIQVARNKVRKDWEVERKIAMCQNGMEMLKTANDLYVMEKSDVDRKTFYRSYDLNQFGGRFLNLPEEFLSKADLKNEQGNVSYFNPQAKLLFYALENKGQKDIYYRLKQDNNEWSEAILLNNSINSIYDENYPFFMPDGKTLYFSSKGHNTMGGYDIFKSVFDSVSNQWSKAQNLSFPINTPSDDIMFITDANETMAWFASTRNSSNNLITVYKVGIIKKNPEATDLSGIYSKDKLAETDLGQIKNMAHLDINISNKAFQEIPFSQKQKLESLVKNDPARQSQNIRQSNLKNIDNQIAVQEMQAGLSDSIKGVIRQIDIELEALKTLYLQTQNFVGSKASSVKQGQADVSFILTKAQKTALPERAKELIDQANKLLFKTLRNDYQQNKLLEIHQNIDRQIAAMRLLSENANRLFGDIQKHILIRNELETKKSIAQLKNQIQQADTLTDFTKIVDFTKGELFYPNYPSYLNDEAKFSAFAVENPNQSLSAIVATENRFAAYIPTFESNMDTDLVKYVENSTLKARQRNKQLAYQLKLTESFLIEKKKSLELLFNEANTYRKTFTAKFSQKDIDLLNLRYGLARKAAFEVYQWEKALSSLKNAAEKSEEIALALTELKTEIEQLIEEGKSAEAHQLKSRLESLDLKHSQIPEFENIIDFDQKQLVELNFPESIYNENDYEEYSLDNQKLVRKSGKAYLYSTVDELVAASSQLQNEQAIASSEQFDTKSQDSNPIALATRSELIREELIDLNQERTDRLLAIKSQSNVLTQKASEKLDQSNSALLQFEQMREDYFAGKMKDQALVLAKQSESQSLLYQSLALKSYAEKIDSIYTVENKLKEQTTDQIFAIEQAWHSNQPEKAEALFRALQKNNSEAINSSAISVRSWIEQDNKNISAKKEQANLAFMNSQTVTDESIKLLLDAQKIREEADKKTNAFKRRELITEAENKEKEAIKKQNIADKELAVGTKLYEEIKKAEAVLPFSAEFEPTVLLSDASKPIVNPENRKAQLEERLELRQIDTSPNQEAQNTLAETQSPRLNKSKLPALNDAMAYETKRYQAQLLAEDLDINKRETVFLLQKGKTLKGEEAIENEGRISQKRKEADSLQTASTKAFAESKNIYNQLPAESKKEVDNSKNDFENYLNNVRKRIAQLLDDVTILSQQAGQTTDNKSKQSLMQQADEKEQVAMYLLLEEFEIIAQRNKQNYRKNALVIESLFQESLSLKEKELMRAVFAQIEKLNLQAEKNRLQAQNDELSFTLKKVLLQDAFASESSALDLQAEAIRMMRENDIEGMLAYQPKEKQAEKSALIEAQKLVSSKLNPEVIANSNQKQAVSSKATEKTAENIVLIKEEKPTMLAVAKPEIIGTAKAEEKPAIIAVAKSENKPEIIGTAKAEEKPAISLTAKAEEKLPSEIAKTLNPGLFKDTNENKINRSAEKLVGIEQKPENKTQSKLPENNPVESVPANATTTNKNTEASAPIANKIFPNVSLASAPVGTQFSVQIAAINQHTTTNNFLNVIELFAIKDDEKSLYRYFSGKFTDLTSAIIRRNSLREQGYSDAFIKTWKDGKSVSINEAIGHIDEATQELMNKTTLTLPSQYKNINFSASNINQLPGTYYSVQVGVYSRPRTSDQLFGIQPLFHNRTKNGLWVYFNGVFKNINEAEKNKANVNTKGIPDAFIVAFNQGEKVPIEKAQKAIQEGGVQPSANDIINLKTASANVDKQLISIGRTTKSAGNTVYKIQIGVYSQAISMDWVAEDLPNGQQVEFFVNEAGKYVYTIGNFQSYEEAAQFNKQKVKALVKDAFVVSF